MYSNPQYIVPKNSKNLQNLLVGVHDITFFKESMRTIQKGIFNIENQNNSIS